MALGIAKLSFVAGLVGAIVLHLAMAGAHAVVALIGLWFDRRARIVQARMRHVHGPLVLPGEPSWFRRLLVRALRNRHAQQAHG